jgi:hypothetical protein
MHSGPALSMVSRSPVPPHSAHFQSFTGMTTTRSGGFSWRWTARSLAAAGRPAGIRRLRQARSASGAALAVKSSGRRSLVAET